MLQAMRNGTKSPLMKFFLLFLAGGFALWGIGDGTNGLMGSGDNAISADKQVRSSRDVALEFDRARRTYLPNTTTAEAFQGGLLNEVMGTLSREVLFSAENASLGLTVTRAMQLEAISNEPSFQDENGKFSEGRFMQTLAGAGYSEADYLKRVTSVLERQQLIVPLAKGLRYSEDLARVVAAHELEKRKVKLTSFFILPENVLTPTKAIIDSFFQENKSSYDVPPLRTAKIGSLSATSIGENIEISDLDIRIAFNDRIDEFRTPETRKIRQMVFENEAAAIAALDRINAGEGFTAVAADTLNWTTADTDLGTVAKTALDTNLAELAFSASVGIVAGPMQTAFGFHLLSIDEIVAGGSPTLSDVTTQITEALRAERAIDLLYDKVNLLEDALGSGATLEEAIARVGGQLDLASNIDRLGKNIDGTLPLGSIGELLQDSAILDLIWSGEVNAISVIQEGSDDMFFVVDVTMETEKRERALEEVKARVIADYKLVEAIKQARSQADFFIAGSELDKDAPLSAAFRRNGIGLDHEAAGLIANAAFAQNVGDIQTIETGREVIAVRTTDITLAISEELAETTKMVTTVMNNSLSEDMTNLFLMSLSKKHDLKLNPAAVQQILLRTEQQ
jgi:peptidyl-prolyl cis-trans isomerase D